MGILDNAKEVAKAVQEIQNLELYRRVLSLHSDIIDLVEENNRLRDENKALASTIALKQKMHFTEPFFYQEGDKTPYCPACWEAKNLAVHLFLAFDNPENTRWDCPSCKHNYLLEKNRGGRTSTRFTPGGPDSWMGN